jgi:hypothetical protein
MKKLFLLMCISVSVFALSLSAFGQQPTRVKFATGATSATASGTLKGFKSKRVFLIKVNAGQTLSTQQIKSESSTKYISVSIADPNGADATDADASCNSRKEITPTIAGDYKITVFECQKADEWSGKFTLKLTVQ